MITINGHVLTTEESIALRAALTGFRMCLTRDILSASQLTEYQQDMLIVTNGYDTHLQRISQLLAEEE